MRRKLINYRSFLLSGQQKCKYISDGVEKQIASTNNLLHYHRAEKIKERRIFQVEKIAATEIKYPLWIFPHQLCIPLFIVHWCKFWLCCGEIYKLEREGIIARFVELQDLCLPQKFKILYLNNVLMWMQTFIWRILCCDWLFSIIHCFLFNSTWTQSILLVFFAVYSGFSIKFMVLFNPDLMYVYNNN